MVVYKSVISLERWSKDKTIKIIATIIFKEYTIYKDVNCDIKNQTICVR